MSLMYAGILFNAELVIYRDRLQRHERFVMALTQVIDSDISNYALKANRPLTQSEIRKQFERILSRYSGPRILVWLSQKNQPPLFPNASTFHSITETSESKSKLQREQGLLEAAGINASGMQKPRIFTYQGNTYFTCSIPLNSGYGILRFLEDVGVSPASSTNNYLLLFTIWIALVIVTTVFIQAIFAYALLPIRRLEHAISSIMLRPSGQVDSETISVNAQPHELKGIATAYSQLSSRLQDSWTRQNLFVKSISHELLTPLTLIRSSSKRLLKNLTGIELKDRNLLASTYQESSRLTLLVRDLLDLARSDAGSLSILRVKFDICHELIGLENDISDLPWGHRVQFDLQQQLNPPREIFAFGDAQRFRQCMLNLLENAAKYSPEDTQIVVVLIANADTISVQVRDSGPGIPLSEREKIFTPFYRTHPNVEGIPGSGIGLAIVSLLMENMGGSVKLVDMDQPGSCFVLQLQRFQAEAAPSQPLAVAIL